MKLTNKLNIPEQFVAYYERNEYSKGNANFSVTELIDSPRIGTLRANHREEIEEDVADRVHAMMGTAFHIIMHEGQLDHHVSEQRLSTEVDGYIVSGGLDVQDHSGDEIGIADYKATKAMALQFNPDGKPEWEAQLNLYGLLYSLNNPGKKVGWLKDYVYVRDWSARDIVRSKDYPKSPIVTINVRQWSQEEQIDYLANRVALHVKAREDYAAGKEIEECSMDERWARPNTWAVKAYNKNGTVKQRATRVLSTEEEANNWATFNMNGKYRVEFRPGESVRCAEYCEVNKFCSQFKAMTDGSE